MRYSVFFSVLAALGISCLSGCAYLRSGAMQRVDIPAQPGDSVRVNGRLVGVGPSSVNLLSGEGYHLSVARASRVRTTESLGSEFNSRALLDLFAWPYFFVDYSLGSHRKLVSGASYSVASTGTGAFKPPEMRQEEDAQRSRLKRSIALSVGCLFAGGALGQAAYVSYGSTRLILNTASLACLGGMAYGVYGTVSSAKRIDRINRRFEFSAPSP